MAPPPAGPKPRSCASAPSMLPSIAAPWSRCLISRLRLPYGIIARRAPHSSSAPPPETTPLTASKMLSTTQFPADYPECRSAPFFTAVSIATPSTLPSSRISCLSARLIVPPNPPGAPHNRLVEDRRCATGARAGGAGITGGHLVCLVCLVCTLFPTGFPGNDGL